MKRLKKTLAIAILCVPMAHSIAQTKPDWEMQPVGIKTRWAKDVHPGQVLPEYPRPQMVRNQWENLNGLWEYAITTKEQETTPNTFEGKILVPFPIESALSGVKKPLLPTQRLWYKRTFTKPNTQNGKRVLLNFGAVDWQATVFVNGKKIGSHTGGYQNFSFDITDALKSGTNELIVSVYDPTDQGPNPRGKQTLNPQNIMYTASSGIWQTVWMETVPTAYITNIYMTPSVDSGFLRLAVNSSDNNKKYTIEAIASNGSTIKGKPGEQLLLPVSNARLWSPDDPYLYNLSVRLLSNGKIIDTIGSYFGMRKIEVRKDDQGIERLFLNNKYTYHLGVLDQGFWPEGLYTAPTDSALQFDIMAIRNMGFNTIRKHIKIEPARWYYHADKMGILVWQDMVTCGGGDIIAHEEFEKENKENIAQLHNYPSIVIWVLFNEGWARYDQQRLTEWLKHADPSRVVDGHTGENYDDHSPKNLNHKWASSDLTDIHDYPGPGIAPYIPGKARVLGEWGGVRVPTPNHQWNDANGWGYIQVPASEFSRKYAFMIKHLKVYEEEGLSGSIYTEPFDVETEENGLMTYDREVIKMPAESLRKIHAALVPHAESYAAVKGVFKAQLTDTADPIRHYNALLQEYKNGRKDSAFLYNLALMADRMDDKTNAAVVSNDYINNSISSHYNRTNIKFIEQFTKKTNDPGFKILITSPEMSDKILGQNAAENKIMSIIYSEEIDKYVKDKNSNPNWNDLEKNVVGKYGALGEEIFLRAKALFYFNRKNWESFANNYNLYFNKYPQRISTYELNEFAWKLFENIEDNKILSQALNWSKSSLTQGESPYYLDTYANLLYKLGEKDEAIKIEEKAINIANKDTKPSFLATLDKMKKEK
ncbi:glycoside hydrolase family 2 TIM barrel-domain containing protein [Chitinophaga sancti]|uniref:glycoside hydrolase family 2 protein n=1 Tax=Chitinophaga sancti TaxID=1004 RepID=UPI002A75622C|nr:sugar-binding domain-containing protein [Chitinophaga sancti]WPQ63327.1 glycoside hydrolase family 2 TIM barrel-domain containing protein [Chitinophaga sancti]